MVYNVTSSFFEKEQAEHTRVKLEILNGYVVPWMRKIILNKHGSRSCSIIDTFAGAGKYSDGSIGSPIILVNEAIRFIEQAAESNFEIGKILLTFIEKDEKNFLQLKSSLEEVVQQELIDDEIVEIEKYPSLSIGIANKTHEKFLDELTNNVEQIIPTIFFMDPFGFNLPFEINERILKKYSNVELLINFMYEEINRFITVDSVKGKMERLFGVANISTVVEQLENADSKERSKIIKGTYKSRLQQVGAKYTLDFDIHTDRGQVKMSIIFATKNINGFDTMKDVLDNISNSGGLEYYSQAKIDDKQIKLEAFNTDYQSQKIDEMSDYIYKICKTKTLSVSKIIDIAKNHPTLPSKYLKRALNILNVRGKIKEVYRINGQKVRKNTFPDDAFVKFL